MTKANMLTPRWTKLRPHPTQIEYYTSQHRFNVTPSGRRSGKTELAKRKLVRRALKGSVFDRPRYFAGAPTRDQAKRIFWEDLKRLVPAALMKGRPSETELSIPLWHGGEIVVVGMDKPERVEGSPWDGGVLDEYGNMKAEAWSQHLRPALSDRKGWCDLIGVPEGRNHYYDLAEYAKAELAEKGSDSQWGYFHWHSADILDEDEIAAAKRDLDLLTFQQEYEGSFVNFEGRAYYAFSDKNKIAVSKLYNPKATLLIMLDFNVAPGVAVIAQELIIRVLDEKRTITCVLGEVYIESNSTTPAVCRKILQDWGRHEGRVEVYGDATGGASGSAQTEGSDWDLVAKIFRYGDPEVNGGKGFGHRFEIIHHAANPKERARVNAVNSRTKNTAGQVRLLVDPKTAPKLVRDLEGVRTLKGGSGEIDKKSDKKLTHLSDALGYYIEYQFPVTENSEWGTTQHTT